MRQPQMTHDLACIALRWRPSLVRAPHVRRCPLRSCRRARRWAYAYDWRCCCVRSVRCAGVFMLVALRKLFILDYKLPYPSGTATGAAAQAATALGFIVAPGTGQLQGARPWSGATGQPFGTRRARYTFATKVLPFPFPRVDDQLLLHLRWKQDGAQAGAARCCACCARCT